MKSVADLQHSLLVGSDNRTVKGGTAHETRNVIYRFIEGLPDEKKNKKKKEDEAVNNIEKEDNGLQTTLSRLTETLNNIERPSDNRIDREVCPVTTGPEDGANHGW